MIIIMIQTVPFVSCHLIKLLISTVVSMAYNIRYYFYFEIDIAAAGLIAIAF